MDLDSIFKALQESTDLVALDTETTGLSVVDGRDHLMGISIAFHHGVDLVSAYLPFRHPVGGNLDVGTRQRFLDILSHKSIILHNGKFDLHSLATLGFVPVGRVYCTMTMAHMVNENWPSKKLDFLAGILLNDHKDSADLDIFVKRFGWARVPADLMEPYARKDAILTRRLFDVLAERLKKQELQQLWSVDEEFLKLLAKMEKRGVLLDLEKCAAGTERGTERMAGIVKTLGFDPAKGSALAKYLLEDLGLPAMKLTPKNKASFDKEAMAEYDIILGNSNDPTAKLVAEYRGWQKSVGSSYTGWSSRVSPDGRLRPNYKVHGTRTGRLSCENPNLQQIPRSSSKAWDGDIKSCFTAPDGYSLIEFDYSQLEFRVAACYAKEADLVADFTNGIDPFIRTAREVFGVFTPETRQFSKTLTYSIQYGAGVNRVSHALDLDPSAARATIDKFYETYPGIRRVSKRASAMADRDGYVKYWTGRKRHFGGSESSHKAFNSIVQGGCAELVKRKMLELSRTVDCDDVQMLLQVHDSVVFQIKNDLVEEVSPLIEKTMANWEEAPEVPLKVEGKQWGK
jgi:DNA polymerase-1